MEWNKLLSRVKPSQSMKGGLSSDKPLYNLAMGAPDIAPPDFIREIIEAYSALDAYNYEPNLGANKTRLALLRILGETGYNIDEIGVVPGAKYGIYMSLKTMLNPGDTVLLMEPFWLSYPDICHALGLNYELWSPEIKDGYLNYSIDRFKENIERDNIKCVILNNPNNPSGKIYDENFIREVIEVCKRKNVWFVYDEVYKDLSFQKNVYIPEPDKCVVRVGSFSKNISTPGLRTGYVIGSKDFISNFSLIDQHVTTCSATLGHYFIQNVSVEKYGQYLEYAKNVYRKRYEAVADVLSSNNIEHLLMDGSFYLFVKAPTENANSFVETLSKEAKIKVTAGEHYGKSFSNYYRVCLTLNKEDLLKVFKAIVAYY